MRKKANNKVKKAILFSTLITVPSAVGLGVTLFMIHSNEQINAATVYGNFLEGENLFKLYSPFIQAPESEKDQVAKAYEQAKTQWKSKDKGLVDKLTQLDKAQEIAFNFYIDHINKIQLKDQEPSTFWTKIVSNQEARIRELDLKEQLTQHKKDQRIKFFDVLYTANNEQKQEYLKNLSEEISNLVVAQNQDLMPYIQLLEATANKIDNLPFQGLKKNVTTSLTPLYSRIISANVRLNEIQIASQDTKNEVAKLKQVLDGSQTEINEINEYLKQIEPYVNNTAYTQTEKDNVKNFLESTKSNLDLVLTKADINQIHTNVITFYQQISDTQKTTAEIQKVIRELSSYVDKFNPILKFNKDAINQLISQVATISDKKELISAKSDLFSQFYALKFTNQLISELNQKAALTLQNNIINKTKATLIKSQIQIIVDQKLPIKQLSNELFAFYNTQTQELENLTYLNNELKLIQSQIEQVKTFKFTNEDIKNQLNELKNQVVKTYSTSVTVPYLSAVKNKLNESLRNILKSNLKQLITLLEEQIRIVKNLNNPLNAIVVDEANKLNKTSQKMVMDFNPIPSAELIEQIKIYNIKLQNLINANRQTSAEDYSKFTDDYLKEAFSNNDPNYVFSQREQKRINLYNSYKKQLDELRAQINNGNGDPALEFQIDEIAKKLQNLTDTASDFRALSLLDKQADQTIKEKKTSANANLFQPFIDAVEKARTQLDALFENPNATSDQVQEAHKALSNALKDLNEADTKILLEQKISEFKNAIDSNYQNNLSSPGASALLKRYNELLENAKDVSDEQKTSNAITRANQLIAITPHLYQAEINKERLLRIIAEKSSAQYTGTKTNTAIVAGRDEIQKADQLIARLNNNDVLPNPEAFENANIELNKRGDEILLAYEQEKIEKINQHIQGTAKVQTNGANNTYKNSLESVNNYANIQKSQLNLERAKAAGEKMEHLKDLADLSSELLGSYNQYIGDNSAKSLSDYIATVLSTNDLSVGDTNDQILAKVNALSKAAGIIRAKKEFLEVAQKLRAVFEKNKDWKIYHSLKPDMNTMYQQIDALIFDNDLTVQQIEAKKIKFESKIKLYETKKADLLNEFNQAVNSVNAKQSEIDADITKLKSNHATYSFDTYYNGAKATYTNDKELAQKPNVDTNDIKAHANKLEIAYQKDLALNALKEIETSANATNFGTTDLHNKIKASRTSFDSSVKATLGSSDLTLSDLEQIHKKIKRFAQLFDLQKRIADYVNANPSRVASSTTSIETIKNDTESSLVAVSDNFNEIDKKYKDLDATFNREADIQAIRERIIDKLESTGVAKGIVPLLNDELGASYDNDVITKLNSYVTNAKTTANTSTSRDELTQLSNKIDVIHDEVHAIATLAKNVASAQNVITTHVNAQNSNLVNTYSLKLATLNAQAKNSYFKENSAQGQNNISLYNQLSNQITFTIQKFNASVELANKLNEIKTIVNNNNNSFNLQSLNGQPGINKLKEINDYLESFETAATNDDYNQAGVDKINTLSSKATSFKNLINADQESLTYANTLATNNKLTSNVDLNDVLALVWDSIPRASVYNNSVLGKDTGNTYLVNDLFNLSGNNVQTAQQYTELADKILTEIRTKTKTIQIRNAYRDALHTRISNLKKTPLNEVMYNDLRNALFPYLDSLDAQNNTAQTFTTSPDESGDLNQLSSKVDIILNKLDELKMLAQKVHELNDVANKVISTDNLVTQNKTQAQTLITKAKEYFNNTDKMKLTGNDSIANLTAQIQEQNYKLSVLSSYEQVKNDLQNDNILTQNEKAVIQSKLNAFSAAFAMPNANAQNLFNTYFRKETDLPAGAMASEKNSLIKYALDNAINLKKEYNRALSFVGLQDNNLDNANVQTKFNQITTLINGANGVTNTLEAQNNDEAKKVQLLSTIKQNINLLIEAKKDQIQEQLTADNQIKTFFDQTNATINSNSSQGSYVDGFEQKGITDLTNAQNNRANLSYSEVNVYLANAKSVSELQIFDLYTKTRNLVENIKTKVLDYINDFAQSKAIVRAGSELNDATYNTLKTLESTINQALMNDFDTTNNYSSKINSLVGIITGNYQTVLDNFTNAVKAKFAEKFGAAQGANPAGFYVALFNKLDSLKTQMVSGNQNLYAYNQAEELENKYDTFKNEYESVLAVYNLITNKKDSGTLANFATLVDKLNKSFLSFEEAIKNTLTKALTFNPLIDVFADIYQNITYAQQSNNTDQIKTTFDTFKNSIQTLIDNVHNENTVANPFDFTALNPNSNLPQQLFELIGKLTEYKDWLKEPNHKEMLLTGLDTNPSKTNPLNPSEPNLQALATFDKKYKVITTNSEYTRKKFIQKFDQIVQTTANANTTEKVEIENNEAFLAMFDQFAFTDKDVKDPTDVKSIFSPLKLKVYIKKYSPNGWFEEIAQTQDEVDRQSLKAKVVYSYESNNTDIGVAQVEKEVVITFKTLDKIEVPNETSGIFINGNNVGIAAKVEVIDVDEAGWNIPQVANASANNATTVKNQVISKVYNKMKAAIFNLNSTNSTSNTGTITPNGAYLNSLKTTNDVNLQNIRYTVENNRARLTAYLDKNNRNRANAKYGFDFENELSLPITYNLSLTSTKDYETLEIIPIDNENGFAFIQLDGGFITGLPGRGKDSTSLKYKPEWYDALLRDQGTGFANIYNNPNSWWETAPDKLPTGLNLNLYAFNIDYDPVKRKVYFYNSWTENILFVINKQEFLDGLNKYKNSNELKQSDRTFLTDLAGKLTPNPANYRPTPEELSKAFSIFASFNGKVFDNSDSTHWLPTSRTGNFGGNPIYPIAGGQSTVFRTTLNNPASATLRELARADFAETNNLNKLIKASARQSLYSALINRFWFKIR
ncbi:hypothetical protein NPA11_01505 [Mycoplasma sp. 1578d]|uniref:hypothetical protein n=1 Tax=Mycoplasma sp. 1578d TaxID=2967299 RepID=UPI00211CBDFF|nr:hypothetical protein [Mycoplasma sp. 1578d]UUM20085.1 hypothetical protein NPA11_01505 [Mycoplasma sp. 1578d]